MNRAAALTLATAGITALLAGCAPAVRDGGGPRGEQVEREAGEDETVVGRVEPDGTFRADTLEEERADEPGYRRETVMTGSVRAEREDGEPELATGYRVQVFAARDRADATAFAREIEALVEEHAVYVERVDAWYKVRVGDFASRERAERLRRHLAERGVEGPWTVRTTIRTAP